MPHNIIKKIINKIPAVQYGKKQEERIKKTEQGRELLSKTKTFKGKLKILREGLKKKLFRYDE
mgnify:CR=1 FL=1